ncbi:MAG: hypothetical protein II453_01910 [Alphaproteobacteria bacterium]|nr:hypothetical protein [Alphaproteobacteria bacterium]
MTNFNDYKEILTADVVTIHNLLKHFKKNDLDYDQHGNIFVNFKKETKKLPILVAHTDNVLGNEERKPVFTLDGKSIFCANNVGIGFDDKAGIIAIIELWKELQGQFRIIFTADEESGGWGAEAIEPERYNQAQYIIELDRKGANDLIQNSGFTRLCSDEFAKKWKELGFKEDMGTFTDLNKFKPKAKNVEMCNLSIGYYNPHTKDEYLNIKDFEKTLERVKRFITENKDVVFEDTTKDDDKQDYYNYREYPQRTDGMVGLCDCCDKRGIVEWDEDAGLYLCEECEEWYKGQTR